MNGDITRRHVILVVACFILHALFYSTFAMPWHMEFVSVVPIALGLVLFWVYLPGYFQRKWVLQADRRAVELIGDRETVAQVLQKLCEANGGDLDQKSVARPSTRARIDAIRKVDLTGGRRP